MNELRRACRNLRARGWRAVLTVGLLSVALAGVTVVFSATDSLAFRRIAYPNADHLLTFDAHHPDTGRRASSYASPALLDTWRMQQDLFAAVHGYVYSTIFLTGDGAPELVRAADVTAGLIDMLGVLPRWGRPATEDDSRRTDAQPVMIDETLARTRFGAPSFAVGRRLETTAAPLLIVGVMPASFRFPDGTQRIWRVFDPRGPLARNAGIALIARAASNATPQHLASMMQTRSEAVYTAAGVRVPLVASPAPLRGAEASAGQRRLLLVLLGAAISLLLTACANVASLELAGALQRARTYAIHLAIGASRASLVRSVLLEGACTIAASGACAVGLAYGGTRLLVTYLPATLTVSVNPIDLDARALTMTSGLAMLAWMLSSVPVAAFAWRTSLLDLLKTEGPSVAASRRGTAARRGLTVAQVALAVMLLVGSTLYVRTYLSLIRLDKGFDSSGVVSLSLTIPPQPFGAAETGVIARTILERLRARPGVLGAFEGEPPPSTGDSPASSDQIEIDNQPPVETALAIPRLWVDPEYFRVLRIPLVAGRMFEAGDPPTDVIVTEALASRLWPGGGAVGHRFRESPRREWNRIIGVVKHVRTFADGTTGPERYFQKYSMRQPPPTAATTASAGGAVSSGADYHFLTITARVDSRARAGDLYQTVRSVDARNILKVEFVDDEYARQFADRLLATRIVTAFGLLAFVVAIAGLYGLMAFLVVNRQREIGIRLALGAAPRQIRALVFASAGSLVLLGGAVGIGGALAASRWTQSQLFGVSATDPFTIVLVTLLVVATALLATWQPARQAARVDPSLLLKG
jgi:predicted permease